MEQFKKPGCVEKIDEKLKKTKEIPEKRIETADLTTNTPYKIPCWSGKPNEENDYSFEVLKSGQIIDKVQKLQKKSYWSFGRLPENDIEMAHPTISRFHAVLQYRPKYKKNQEKEEGNIGEGISEGWYIYDLGSTHGTFLNKQIIPPKVYIRMRVGHLLKLGTSTRSYILQGPTEDEEPESELSITEIKAKRQQDIEKSALEKIRLREEAIERESKEGCSWGMAEDADEETDLSHNPFAITNNEELFLDDPKKTLRGYFEREGAELIYKCDEMSAGSFVCRIELPIDDANGRSVVAEVVNKGKKKDCVVQCALEACRILDRHGVLRQANQEPLKRKKLKESDSDEDEFWDRTGDVLRKKQRKTKGNVPITLTYEDLIKEENNIDQNIKEIERKINEYQEQQQRLKAHKSEEGEDLDAFMENLQEENSKLDKTEIRKLRIEEHRLKSEKQKLQRLITITKPIDMSFTMQSKQKGSDEKIVSTKKQLPMIGKRNQFNKFRVVKVPANKNAKPVALLKSDEEEVEEKEEPNDKNCSNDEILFDKSLNYDATENTEKYTENLNVNETGKSQDDKINEENSESLPSLMQSGDDSKKEIGTSNKKRRQRIRLRGKREEVDMSDDVEYESSDKYAKWLPPENQSGDGITELNKKFGY